MAVNGGGGVTDCVQLVTLHGGQRLTAYYFPLGLSVPWQGATIWRRQRQLGLVLVLVVVFVVDRNKWGYVGST